MLKSLCSYHLNSPILGEFQKKIWPKNQKFQNCLKISKNDHFSAGRTNFFKSAVSCDVAASVGVTVYVVAEDFDALNFDVREDVDDGADGA